MHKINGSFIAKTGQLLMSKEHRTKEASEKANDLWCYKCDSMDEGDRCINLTDNTGDNSTFKHKCINDKRICMVRLQNAFVLVSFLRNAQNCTMRLR